MDQLEQNPASLPPQAAERSIVIPIFGFLNFVVGGYPLINVYPRLFKAMADVLKNGSTKITSPEILFLGLSCLVGIAFSIWLVALGIGLLRMKKWARRGSVIYAWIAIGLFVIVWGYSIIVKGLIIKLGSKL